MSRRLEGIRERQAAHRYPLRSFLRAYEGPSDGALGDPLYGELPSQVFGDRCR